MSATAPENPLESLHDVVAFGAKDWCLYERDAWMYGIICGWGDCLEEVARHHQWTEEDVARLRRLRARYARLQQTMDQQLEDAHE